MSENTITTHAETRDTVILGSGCAGLTAAIYASRAQLVAATCVGLAGQRGADGLEFDLAIVVRDRFVWFHAGKTNASGEPAQIDNVDS